MTDELTQRMERAVSDFEAAASFLKSRYFEAVVTKALSDAVVAASSPWLDRAAAAAYARCSTSEIDRCAGAGYFETYHRGGTPLFLKAEIDEAIKSGVWKKRTEKEVLERAAA